VSLLICCALIRPRGRFEVGKGAARALSCLSFTLLPYKQQNKRGASPTDGPECLRMEAREGRNLAKTGCGSQRQWAPASGHGFPLPSIGSLRFSFGEYLHTAITPAHTPARFSETFRLGPFSSFGKSTQRKRAAMSSTSRRGTHAQ